MVEILATCILCLALLSSLELLYQSSSHELRHYSIISFVYTSSTIIEYQLRDPCELQISMTATSLAAFLKALESVPGDEGFESTNHSIQTSKF